MKKAVIFDLDGTLLNTISDLNNTVNLTYKYFGIAKENTKEKTMAMVGHGIKNLVEQMFVDNPSLKEEAYHKFLEIYDKEYYKTTLPYNGVNDLVDKLTYRGIKVGVNSNKNDIYVKKLIKMHFGKIKEDYVLGKVDGIKVKPDPEGANIIIDKMGVDKKDVLYIGDSPTDIQTAKNAGINFACVTWGFRSEKQLVDAGATRIINEPMEILRVIQY